MRFVFTHRIHVVVLRVNELNDACCDIPGVCTAGVPTECDAKCALVFVPFYTDCREVLFAVRAEPVLVKPGASSPLALSGLLACVAAQTNYSPSTIAQFGELNTACTSIPVDALFSAVGTANCDHGSPVLPVTPALSHTCLAFPTPRNSTAQCSDQAGGVSCRACELFGTPDDTGERDCPMGCTCVAFCGRAPQDKGFHARPQDDGGEGLYSQLCLDTGEWSETYTSADTACVDVDECQDPQNPHPCQNGGECFATYPIKVNTYHCACQPGSNGKNCENDIDGATEPRSHTLARPCCARRRASLATCLCLFLILLWRTPLLSADLDDACGGSDALAECGMGADTNPCKNGGVCFESNPDHRNPPTAPGQPPRPLPADWEPIGLGEYKCDCSSASMSPQNEQYSGETCEAPTRICETQNPCLNGAECVDTPTSVDQTSYYACECAGGYEGTNCDADSSLSYATYTESKSVTDSTDTGEELNSDGTVNLSDGDLQFFDDDNCVPARPYYGAPDPCLQTIGVRFTNVTIPKQVGALPPVREAKLAFKVNDIPAGNLAQLRVQIDVMTVSNAPPMAADAAFGISQATDASCLMPTGTPCFYPGDNAAAVQRVTWDVPPAQRPGDISETNVDVDIASLLNPLVQTADWQPGNAVLFKFTLISPPPPPYDPYNPYAVHTTGLRVFEAKRDGYPKLTYTACTGGNCIPVASGTAPKVKTCKLDALSIGHSKEPECSYNGTAIVIGDQSEIRGPQSDQDYTTSCTIQCCEGYQPYGVDQYRCEASGAWRDTDGGDIDVSCQMLDECRSRPCQNGGECSMPDISAITELDDDHCAIPTKTNGHIFTCACTGDAADFAGDLCQSQTDDCASDPCHHGAACIDGMTEYTCNCAAGYNGGCDDPADSTTCVLATVKTISTSAPLYLARTAASAKTPAPTNTNASRRMRTCAIAPGGGQDITAGRTTTAVLPVLVSVAAYAMKTRTDTRALVLPAGMAMTATRTSMSARPTRARTMACARTRA
eukprot:COSAG06_NODE_3941_length_4742_cov_2.669283_1_plen_1010_part_00